MHATKNSGSLQTVRAQANKTKQNLQTIQKYQTDLNYVNSIWEGYHRKLAVMKECESN